MTCYINIKVLHKLAKSPGNLHVIAQRRTILSIRAPWWLWFLCEWFKWKHIVVSVRLLFGGESPAKSSRLGHFILMGLRYLILQMITKDILAIPISTELQNMLLVPVVDWWVLIVVCFMRILWRHWCALKVGCWKILKEIRFSCK